MSGVVMPNGQQWERCTGEPGTACGEFCRIEQLDKAGRSTMSFATVAALRDSKSAGKNPARPTEGDSQMTATATATKTFTEDTPLATVLTKLGVAPIMPGDVVAYASRRRGETRTGLVLEVEPLEIGARVHCFGDFVPHVTVALADETGETGEVRRCRADKLTVIKAAKLDEPVLLVDCPIRAFVDDAGKPVEFSIA